MSYKVFDLEERTLTFARNIRIAVKQIKQHGLVSSDINQLIRSSGSVAANYVEANNALGTKDFIYRLKLCRKESAESQLWIELLLANDSNNKSLKDLHRESDELQRIFGFSIRKLESKSKSKT